MNTSLKKEQFGVNQVALWKKILAISFLVILLAAAVILVIRFSSKTEDTELKNTSNVERGPLSSNLSSNGVIQKIGTSIDVPLAVALENGVIEQTEEITTRSLLQTLLNGQEDEYILYEVTEVNPKYTNGKVNISSDDVDEEEYIIKLKPVKIEFDEDEATKQAAILAGFTTTESLMDYLFDTETGLSKVKFVTQQTAPEEIIFTSNITNRLKSNIKFIDNFTYTLSGVSARVGDYVKINDTLMHLAYEEWFTVFTLSEYDVAPINARMNKGERVYASVGINALNANKLVAEITEIKTGSNVSGVSYFSLYARLIFPKIAMDEDGNEVGSYSYYSEDLDDKTVENLGIDFVKNVEEESLLSNYSVTITAQKTVVTDKLIIPTKCIYYDDTNKPYVLVVDKDNKETRTYIEIILSTGKDAAVAPREGYKLNEGDAIRYTAEESLLSSLF